MEYDERIGTEQPPRASHSEPVSSAWGRWSMVGAAARRWQLLLVVGVGTAAWAVGGAAMAKHHTPASVKPPATKGSAPLADAAAAKGSAAPSTAKGGAPSAVPPAAPGATPSPGVAARASLKDALGHPVGQVQLLQTPKGVLLTADLMGLPSGPHGFHIHETGKCDPPFKTAGGHFQVAGAPAKKHGYKSAAGSHAGDLVNVHIAENGSAQVELLLPDVALEKGAPNGLLDADGSSLVIHATADDYATDPAGNSGARIACGVVVAATTP
jgi:Cu-Zn family superoxide dismutase